MLKLQVWQIADNQEQKGITLLSPLNPFWLFI